jgi:hypothetical protein
MDAIRAGRTNTTTTADESTRRQFAQRGIRFTHARCCLTTRANRTASIARSPSTPHMCERQDDTCIRGLSRALTTAWRSDLGTNERDSSFAAKKVPLCRIVRNGKSLQPIVGNLNARIEPLTWLVFRSFFVKPVPDLFDPSSAFQSFSCWMRHITPHAGCQSTMRWTGGGWMGVAVAHMCAPVA